jgi:type II secretory pathway component HofQ
MSKYSEQGRRQGDIQSNHKQRDVHTASNIQSRTERLGTERRQEVYQADGQLRQVSRSERLGTAECTKLQD